MDFGEECGLEKPKCAIIDAGIARDVLEANTQCRNRAAILLDI